MYEQRNFAIFSLTELNKIDFSMVLETSAETLRRSVDGTKSFVKWDQELYDPTPYEIINAKTNQIEIITPNSPSPPSFIAELETLEGPYTYEEMLEILNGEEWTSPMGELV